MIYFLRTKIFNIMAFKDIVDLRKLLNIKNIALWHGLFPKVDLKTNITRVGKVRYTGQIRPAEVICLAHGAAFSKLFLYI